MVTIAQFLADPGVRVASPHTVQFVSMRCAALYSTFVNAIPSSDVDRSELRRGLMEKVVWFIGRAQSVQQKVAPESAELGEDGFVLGNVKKMQDLYVQRAVNARASTGHFSNDPIIHSDAEYCRAIVSP
jgi:hypothetical protein